MTSYLFGKYILIFMANSQISFISHKFISSKINTNFSINKMLLVTVFFLNCIIPSNAGLNNGGIIKNYGQAASVTIELDADKSSVSLAGEIVNYTYKVTNNGDEILTGIELTDNVVGIITFDDDMLEPNESKTITATYEVTQVDIDLGEDIVNEATVSASEGPTDMDYLIITVVKNPSIEVKKELSPLGQTYDEVGDVITYRITLLNDGNVAVYSPAVTDIGATSGPTYQSGDGNNNGILDRKETWVYTANHVIDQSDLNRGFYTNTAVGSGSADTSGDGTGDTEVTDSDSESVNAIQNPGLTLTKTASPTTYNSVGQETTYTIVVENSGNVDLTNVSVSDPLTGLNTTIPSLAPGGQQTFTESYTITQTDLSAGSVENTATASGTAPDNTTISATDTEITEAIPGSQLPALTITKTASPSTFNSAGQEITYTIEIENSGNVELTSVTVSDPLTGLTENIASMLPGATETYTPTYTISQADMNSGSVENTATASGTAPDNSTVTASDTETITGSQLPALSITKTASPSTFNSAGQEITYTIEVENSGNVELTSVSVSDPLTGLTENIASMLPGATETYTPTYTISQADMNSGSVENTATVSGTAPDNSTVSASDTETITGSQLPALSITKTASPSTFNSAGQEITYTIEVENSGNVELTSVTVSDPLTGLTENIASMLPGATETYTPTYTISQADMNSGSVENTATASGTAPDNSTVTASDTETITGSQLPALSITKTASPSTFNSAGQEITYTIEVENSGNVELTSVSVSDPLTGLTENIASMLPGATETYTPTYTISQADMNSGSVENTATASGTAPDNSTVTASDTETITGSQLPALSITKTASPSTFNSAGQEITYTIEVENSGNVELTSVSVSDPLTGLTENIASMLPGATETYTPTYTISQADMNSGSVENTATASGTAPDNSTVTASDTETITGSQLPALTITKTASPATFNSAGQEITYTIEVENSGNVELTSVSVSDPLTGLTENIASMLPGATETYTPTYTISQADMNSGSVENTATASGTAPDNSTVTASDTETITGSQLPALSITKTASPSTFNSAGQEITYTIEVENSGNVELTSVSVSDPLTGLTENIASMLPGATETYTPTYTISQADMNSGSVENTATASGTAPDNSTVTASDTETITGSQLPALSITKTASPSTFNSAGQEITYTIEVENSGNVELTSVSVSDPLTGLTENIASMLPGATETYTPTYTISQADMNSGSVENTATASGTAPDNSTVTASDTETITGSQLPALSITKTASPSTFNSAGQEITYTIEVENSGNVELTSVSVSDPLTGLTENIASMLPGATETYTPTYTISQADMNSGSVENTATASGTAPDNSTVTASDTETITGSQLPALSITKTASPSTFNSAGQEITYTIEVENSGNVELTSVSVSDPLTGLTENIASMLPGATETYTPTYTISQADMNSGSVENTATASGTAPDNSTVTASDTETITGSQLPALTITKTASPSTFNSAGQEITYTIEVENSGNVELTSVSVSDPLTGLTENIASMLPGATETYTPTYTITQADMNSGSVENTATASGTAPDNSTVTASDTETITGSQLPALSITKTASPSTFNSAGQEITYTIEVENSGNVELTSVSVSDPLTGLTENIASMLPGATETYTPTYTISQLI
jgi:uncharacterized repeat protein (TIGR01451 family)